MENIMENIIDNIMEKITESTHKLKVTTYVNVYNLDSIMLTLSNIDSLHVQIKTGNLYYFVTDLNNNLVLTVKKIEANLYEMKVYHH